jgi:hypothetical protein
VVEAAGVELDRLSEYGLILKNASKSETLETVESLKILLQPPNCPQHNRPLAAGARLLEGEGVRFHCNAKWGERESSASGMLDSRHRYHAIPPGRHPAYWPRARLDSRACLVSCLPISD